MSDPLFDSMERELQELEYALSHDLRAPLRTLLGFSAVLQEDYSEALDEDGRDLVARIQRASQQMRGMLDALLYLSRKTRAPLNPTGVDLGVLARERVEVLNRGSGAPLSLKLSGDLNATGDEPLLREVLWALLENAARFNPGGVVTLSALGEARFELRDDGPGCAPSFIERAFEPFAREDNAASSAGAGLGPSPRPPRDAPSPWVDLD